MVVLAHVVGGAREHVYTGQGYALATTPFWNLGTTFVYLFFAISGFVIVPSVLRYSPSEFIARRLVRIYPLFLACSLAYLALHLWMPKASLALDWSTVASALLFTNLLTGSQQLTPNAWSLTYEVMFYTLAAGFGLALARRSVVVFVLVAAAFSAFLISFNVVAFFVIGALTYVVQQGGLLDRLPFRRLLEGIAAIGFLLLASRQHFDAEAMTFVAAAPLMVGTALYFALAVHPRSLTATLLTNRFAQHVGTISYSLYLVHPYVYLPIRLAFSHFGLFTGNVALSMTIFGIVVVAASLAASQVFHYLFERLPNEIVFRRAPSAVVTDEGSGALLAARRARKINP